MLISPTPDFIDHLMTEALAHAKSAAQAGEVLVSVDGKTPVRVAAARAAQFGVNYLRVEFRADADAGHVTIGQLSAQLPR